MQTYMINKRLKSCVAQWLEQSLCPEQARTLWVQLLSTTEFLKSVLHSVKEISIFQLFLP